jgi:uncharacterized protein DUF2752
VQTKSRTGTYWGVSATLGAGAVAALYVFPPEQSRFYPRCLFNVLTGLQCPGCGGLRAAHRLLHGDIMAAWHLNALAVLGAAAGVIWLAARVWRSCTGQDLLQPLRRTWLLWAALVAMLVFAIVRNLPHAS